MKERPIIFNAEMVKAILDGRKTQTRRLVPEWQLPMETKQDNGDKPETRWMAISQRDLRWGFGVFGATEEECASQLTQSLCPFGCRHDRLWVRETFSTLAEGSFEQEKPAQGTNQDIRYFASEKPAVAESTKEIRGYGWIPSIHMPRWASRINLEITDVRVERLNDISEEDAMAEGCKYIELYECTAKDSFSSLWQSIYGEESWSSNPWVWVIEFNRVEGGAA